MNPHAGTLAAVQSSGNRLSEDMRMHRLTLDEAVYEHEEHGAMPHVHSVRGLPACSCPCTCCTAMMIACASCLCDCRTWNT